MSSLHFVHPWLLLLAVAVPILAEVLRRVRRMSPTPRSYAILLGPALAILLGVVALADPVIRTGSDRATVLAVDRSGSIDPRMAKVEDHWTGKLGTYRCPAPCRVVRFASTPNARGGGNSAPGPGDTDLQSALSTAIGLAPSGGRVAVITDGGQTTGDLTQVSAQARARGVAVDEVPLTGSSLVDASVTAIHAPPAVRVGDTVPLTVTVHSTVAATAELKITRNGGATAAQPVRLRVGDNPLLLQYAAARRGWNSFTATIDLPGDAVKANDAGSAVVDVERPPRVLLAASPGSSAPALFAGRHLQVTTVAPGSLPTTAAAYRRYDAVVLDDISAESIGNARAAVLDAAVQRGGLGLLALGGPHSFSLGHYWHTPLQQVMPVTSLVPGKLQRRNLAIELVLDHSGSMMDTAGGVQKIAMARSGARQSAAFIARHRDQLGIVDFDIHPHVFLPLQKISPGSREQKVDQRIATLQADGGTNIFRGLKAGWQALVKSHAKQRHLILMTDGISEKANYGPLLESIRADHIAVATVALGSDADRGLLKQIAQATSGHAYATNNAHDLPHIFVKETQLSAKPVRVRGRLKVYFGENSTIVRSLAGQTLPGLSGNVVTTLKTGARADLLATGRREARDPALAEWQLGSGRTVAWTPGVGKPWAPSWTKEGALFDNALRWAQRGVTPNPLTPQVPADAPGTLQIDLASAGQSAAGVTLVHGTLIGPGGTHQVRFEPDGPGLFSADVAALPEGVYRFSLSAQGDRSLHAAGSVALPYPAEASPNTAYASPLGQVVAQTGGRVLKPGDPGALSFSQHSLRELFVLLALIAFLGGVLVRLAPGVRNLARRTAA
jgi:Ca-activated chloride channel homolog